MLRNLVKLSCRNGHPVQYCKKINVKRHLNHQSFVQVNCLVAVHPDTFSQRRSYSSSTTSSDGSDSVVHKVLFVNASAPDVQDTISAESFQTEQIFSADISQGIEYIPPPPAPPEALEAPDVVLNALGEQTFASLGIGGGVWPSGWMQSALEYLHVSTGLPWWGTIAVATVIIRICVFPLVVESQKNMAKMNRSAPILQALNAKMSEARTRGNHLEAAQAAHELQKYSDSHGLKPMKAALLPLAQAPIFVSMFFALRNCSNLPVESFKTGGMYWFTDLTIADPYYILPLVTCCTMLITIELGSEGNLQAGNQKSHLLKYFLRALPVAFFPFVINFPTAVLCYWVSTNFFSLLQVGFLRTPHVRDYFGIGKIVKHNKGDLAVTKKGFRESITENFSNARIQAEIRDRAQIDRVRFQKSGVGPLVKTFKRKPTLNVIEVKAVEKNR